MLNILSAGLELFGQALDRSLIDKNLQQELVAKQRQLGFDQHQLDLEYDLEMAKTKLAAHLEPLAMVTAMTNQQLKLNQAEAQHVSIFVAGWRPAIGWVSAAGFAYCVLVQPLCRTFWPNLVEVDSQILFQVLLGMLGLGGLRTFEKLKGVNRRH